MSATSVRVTIAGVDESARVRAGSVQVHDVLNDAPNTCSLVLEGTAPSEQQPIRVTLQDGSPERLLLAGTLQTVDVSYQGDPPQPVYVCTAIDDTPRAQRRLPFGAWTSVSATTVVEELVAAFAPDFTTTHVEADLPPITIFLDGSEGLAGALTQVTKLVGGYYYWDDGDLHLFTTESDDSPDPIDATHPPLDDPPIRVTRDPSQVRTRVYGKGHGEAVLADLAAGETIVPIADATMFNPAGGQAISETQRFVYTGVDRGGGGSFVGGGVTPSTALTPTASSGSGIEAGAHDYAYTWVTAAGETKPSPLQSVILGVVPTPTVAPTVYAETRYWTTQAGLAVGDVVDVGVSYSADFYNSVGPTAILTGGSITVPLSDNGMGPALIHWAFAGEPAAGALAQYAQVWWRKNGGSWNRQYPVAVRTAQDTSIFSSTGGFGGASPTVQQAALGGIAIGPTGTTQRKVYRTAAGGTQLKLQQTIANNSATAGVLDTTADASLGANAPTSDTSGLSTEDGQVNAGSTSLPTTSAAPFNAAGGWARLSGDQTIRYHGISGNTLTDIPTSGPGALVSTVSYGAPVVAAPSLTGVTGSAVLAPALTDPINALGYGSTGEAYAGWYSSAFDGGIHPPYPFANGDGTREWAYTDVTAGGETLPGPTLTRTTPASVGPHKTSLVVPVGAAGTIARRVYRTVAGGSQLKFSFEINNNVTTGTSDPTTDAALGADAPTVNTTTVYGLPALLKGAPINLWVQRDDLGAQADLAAVDGSDGIIEHLIVDERRGEASLAALCDADLAQFARSIVTVTCAVRDVKIKSGKTLVFDLATPAIHETLTIQDVTITEIDIAPNLPPRYTVTASSVRFSLEDLLRRMVGTLGGT